MEGVRGVCRLLVVTGRIGHTSQGTQSLTDRKQATYTQFIYNRLQRSTTGELHT